MDTNKAALFYTLFSEFIIKHQERFNLNSKGWKIIARPFPVLPSFENGLDPKKYFPITLTYCVSDSKELVVEILKVVERFILNMDCPTQYPQRQLSDDRIKEIDDSNGKYLYCYYNNFSVDENSEELKLDEL